MAPHGTRPACNPPAIATEPHREICFTAAGIVITLVASVFTTGIALAVLREHLAEGRWLRGFEPLAFAGLVAIVVYGSLVYQLARLGYLRRLQAHVPASEADLARFLMRPRLPSLTVLVPAYKEDPEVVRKTLLSAALLDYPNRRVVLLIDDPPIPDSRPEATALGVTRGLVEDVGALLEVPRRAALDAWDAFRRRQDDPFDPRAEAAALAMTYDDVANWFRAQAQRYQGTDHAHRLFVNVTLAGPAARYRARSKQLTADGVEVTPRSVFTEYQRLVDQFTVTLASFERKQYVNLSHEPNKAMNLNSYLAVMGRHFREETIPGWRSLVPVGTPGDASMSVPDSDFVLILDADSILHPAYATRLIHFLEQPANHRVAVAQTPYSAFPGTSRMLERVAGATTDIQYLIHQGFTFYGATFWVGANAIVRKRALDAVAQRRLERGFEIPVFIQDRTVIEDTESSIDLAAAGWSLHNYPERLAYSATPPDFGSLLIQRRRWANGGLIIVPKLLRHLCQGWGRRDRLVEVVFRLHYLTSLAGASLALLTLLSVSFDRQLMSIWLPLSAAPYYALYGRDLRQAGYLVRDLPRVYALNLLLLPVNLAGVLQSIRQLCTGRKSPFGRTPKIEGRTAAPPSYVFAEYGLLATWLLGATMEGLQGRPINAAFALLNAAFLYYALHVFIEHRNAWADVGAVIQGLQAHVLGGLRVPSPTILLARFRRGVAGAGLELATDRQPPAR